MVSFAVTRQEAAVSFGRVLGVEQHFNPTRHNPGGSTMVFSRWFAVFSCLTAASLLSFPEVVQAHPGSGGNCANCHGNNQPTASQILAALAFQNAPMFEVKAGEAIDLKEVVHPTTDPFAVALTGLISNAASSTGTVSLVSGNVSGVNNTLDKLVFTLDPTWTTKPTSGTNPKYYTQGSFSSGTASDQTFTYHMAVGASTPSDYYQLTFTTAGGAEDWSNPLPFYLHVLPAVPEPSTLVLLGMCSFAIIVSWRRKRAA
jgi:hypothetical protein